MQSIRIHAQAEVVRRQHRQRDRLAAGRRPRQPRDERDRDRAEADHGGRICDRDQRAERAVRHRVRQVDEVLAVDDQHRQHAGEQRERDRTEADGARDEASWQAGPQIAAVKAIVDSLMGAGDPARAGP